MACFDLMRYQILFVMKIFIFMYSLGKEILIKLNDIKCCKTFIKKRKANRKALVAQYLFHLFLMLCPLASDSRYDMKLTVSPVTTFLLVYWQKIVISETLCLCDCICGLYKKLVLKWYHNKALCKGTFIW